MNDSTIRLSADTSALTDSLSKIAEEMTAMKDAVSSSAAAMGANLDASAKQAEATNAAIHGLDESVKTVTDSIEAQTKTVTDLGTKQSKVTKEISKALETQNSQQNDANTTLAEQIKGYSYDGYVEFNDNNGNTTWSFYSYEIDNWAGRIIKVKPDSSEVEYISWLS